MARATRGVHAPGMRRRAFLRLVGAGAGWSLAGPFFGAQARAVRAAARETALFVGTQLTMKSLDPGRTIEASAYTLNHATYDSLVTFDGEDLRTPKPSLATGWSVSADGRAYTFKLRGFIFTSKYRTKCKRAVQPPRELRGLPGVESQGPGQLRD